MRMKTRIWRQRRDVDAGRAPARRPTRKPATTEPKIEPSPPITTTANTDDDQVGAHAALTARIGAAQHPGQPGQRDAEAEHRGDPAAHVDAERPGQLGPLGRRADDHADPGPGQHQPDARAQTTIEKTEHEHLVGREVETSPRSIAPVEPGRPRVGLRRDAVLALDQVLQDQRRGRR